MGEPEEFHSLRDLMVALRRELKVLNEKLDATETIYTTVRFWTIIAALMTLSIGLVLILSPAERVSANAYWGLSTYGGADVWGSAFFATAVATLLCSWICPKFLPWAVLIQTLPYAGFALAFTLAALRFPDANLTAPPVYAWITLVHLLLFDFVRKEVKGM